MNTEKFITYNRLQGSVKTFDDLIGKIVIKIDKDDAVMSLWFDDFNRVKFYHEQNCCESVYIDDVCGDLHDLIGSPLIVAEEVSTCDIPDKEDVYGDSCTWTFYRFATQNGDVTVKWLGSSNGYYSESVDVLFEYRE